MRPVKTQINLRIRAVWSDSSQSTWRGFKSLASKMRPGIQISLLVLGLNDTSALVGHFVSSPREREKRDRRDSRGDEREGKGKKREMKENEGTEEIITFSPTLTCWKDSSPCPTVSQYQLDAPVTKATGHLCLTQPPLDSDQTTRIRLNWIFAGHTCLKVRFLTLPLSFKQKFLLCFLLPHKNISCGIH